MTRSVYTLAYERLCERLAAARRERGLTQAQVAASLGRPQSYVAKVERGERRVDVVEFLELTNAIGAEPKAILTEVDHVLREGSS